MKIIISHDVDHINITDHYVKDLYVPKFLVRSFIALLHRNITLKVFINRIVYVFKKRQNRIPEILHIDKENGVPSSFYFGMENGLGMSYRIEKAQPYIQMLQEQGIDVGVHGIAYADREKMSVAYKKMQTLLKRNDFGIRMHYVRYDSNTFANLAECGYLYDTTEYNKLDLEMKNPYKVKEMWEFPLMLMDSYIFAEGHLDLWKKCTMEALESLESQGLSYCTILFHDVYYCEKAYPNEKAWYDWLLSHLKEKGYEFISYRDAIKELENAAEHRIC